MEVEEAVEAVPTSAAAAEVAVFQPFSERKHREPRSEAGDAAVTNVDQPAPTQAV